MAFLALHTAPAQVVAVAPARVAEADKDFQGSYGLYYTYASEDCKGSKR